MVAMEQCQSERDDLMLSNDEMSDIGGDAKKSVAMLVTASTLFLMTQADVLIADQPSEPRTATVLRAHAVHLNGQNMCTSARYINTTCMQTMCDHDPSVKP